MVKKLHLEFIGTLIFVLGGTYVAYKLIGGVGEFWSAQKFWNVALIICWLFVSAGYYHQGWKVHKRRDSSEVSLLLPVTVFIVQCILFVKGIYYHDWSLIAGAMMVNSGVVFSIYQIVKNKPVVYNKSTIN
ncbi:MAG: hypothetical protein AAB590_01965 [Patescibacteria group bacterium]|mgnify:CR=1 FL=1